MPGYSPMAVVNEFLRRRADDAWPQQMFVQKLAYIAHGWNLAINRQPLTDRAPEAWDNGPVYRDVWDHVRDFGYRGPSCMLLDPVTGEPYSAALTIAEQAVIDHVWRKYGSKTASELSKMTHEPGTPWSKAYFARGRNALLNNEDIEEHYRALAMAGRGGQ